MHGEGARFPVDEDALAPPRLAQQKREGVDGDGHAPPDQNPGEPQHAWAEPEIDGGAQGRDHDIGHEMSEEDAHRQVLEHAIILMRSGQQDTPVLRQAGALIHFQGDVR